VFEELLEKMKNVAAPDSCLHHGAVGQKVLSLLMCSASLKYTTNRLRLCSCDQDKTLTSGDFGSDELTTNNISQYS
jgi:hypothetical protein